MNLRLSWRKNRPDLEALLRGGFPSFVWQRQPEGVPEGVPVFCYHAADPDTVEADFAFLAENGYQTWSGDQLLHHMRAGSDPENQAVVLTVDDGAYDLRSVLYPALKRFGFCAVAFVAPAFHRDHYDLCDEVRPCTWDELREVDESGHIDVQAHTWSHRYLPNWPEPVDLVGIDTAYSRGIQGAPAGSVEEDLDRAKQELEERLRKRVAHLAFPMYTGTDEAIRAGQALDYASFWWGTLPHRPANRPGDPVTHVARISAEFIRRLPGAGRMALGDVMRRRISTFSGVRSRHR